MPQYERACSAGNAVVGYHEHIPQNAQFLRKPNDFLSGDGAYDKPLLLGCSARRAASPAASSASARAARSARIANA
jgi:hypothetical protein